MSLPDLSPASSSANPLEGVHLRLLFCMDCRTLEEFPDWDGPVKDDVLLGIISERHRFPNGEEHKGQMFRVPLAAWSRPEIRKELINRIKGEPTNALGLASIDEHFYETRNMFFDDALTCYGKHLRPKGRCPDWKHDSKRLQPNITKAERREAGLPILNTPSGPKVYLCDFCPAKMFMQKNFNRESGLDS